MKNYKVRREETPTVKRMTYPVRAFAGIDGHADENSLPLNTAAQGYNIGFKAGSVVTGTGFSEPEIWVGRVLEQPREKGLHFSQVVLYPRKNLVTGERKDRLIGRNAADGKLYRINLNDGGWAANAGLVYDADTCGIPIFRMGGDGLLLCNPKGKFDFLLDDGVAIYPAPHLTSICCQKGRAFGVCPEENRLCFSALNDPVSWSTESGGGYIRMEEDGGRAQEAVSFQGAVYLFKENAIMQLKVYSDPAEFSLTKVFQTNAYIYPKSVAVGENAIYFLTDDGLYSFDGYDARQIFESVTEHIDDKQWSFGLYFGCKYYLATHVDGAGTVGDEAETLLNNALIVCDLALGTASIARGIDILWLTPIGKSKENFLLAGFRNPSRSGQMAIVDNSGKLFGAPLEKYWASGETDLQEPARYKIIRRAFITSKHPTTVEFNFDGIGCQYTLNGSPNAQLININRTAERLKIIFRSTAEEFLIRDMTIEVDMVRRYYGQGK